MKPLQIGGFTPHAKGPLDLVVCQTCGTTLGTEESLKLSGTSQTTRTERETKIAADHKPLCTKIIEHRRKHRFQLDDCQECRDNQSR